MSTKPSIRVAAAVVSRGNRFLLTLRPDGGHMAGYWEFPGGKVEPDETSEQALRRELREELGVELGYLHALTTFEHEYELRHVHLEFFKTEIVAGVPRPLEVAALGWFTSCQMPRLPLLPADVPLIQLLERRQPGDGHEEEKS
ncbi:MAG: (deoxy)nucleoside triphosphate pyrophosphohydrolase [Acidobacteriota bacterium]|nr:MAG: (deoxy)nucleoside triphosphate pyrophosphohydrolase [Acidobacteriota bacterium]